MSRSSPLVSCLAAAVLVAVPAQAASTPTASVSVVSAGSADAGRPSIRIERPGAEPIVLVVGANAQNNAALVKLLSTDASVAPEIARALAVSPSTVGSRSVLLSALSTLTELAIRQAGNGDDVSAVARQLTGAVVSNGSAIAQDVSLQTDALAAITTAAVRAAPSHALMVAQGAASGLVNTKIGEAISAAKTSNPSASPAALAQAGNSAANTPAVTAALGAIATAATGSLVSTSGMTNDTSAASTVAQTVASAVNTGSSNGVATAVALHRSAGTVEAPQVTVTVVSTGSTMRVTALSAGSTQIASTATITGTGISNLETTTVTTPTVSTAKSTDSTIIPALDQTQPIVSPSKG